MKKKSNGLQTIEALLHPETRAVILGSMSRTWYVDCSRLVELLMFCSEYGVSPIVIGDGPFRVCADVASKAAQGSGIFLLLDPEDAEALVAVERAEVCFAFTSRLSEDVLQTSPLMPAMLRRGVPTIALPPKGGSTQVVPEG